MFMRKFAAAAAAAAFAVTSLTAADIWSGGTLLTEAVVSKDYAPQLMHISLYDDSANLTAAGTADKAELTAAGESGSLQEQWRIDYCGADSAGSYYKIVNAASGRLLTPTEYSVSEGSEMVIFGNENDHSQYWYIQPVDTDVHGNDLHYRILNYADASMALTYDASGAQLSAYDGDNSQKWLLNCADLQGFAGYCFNDNEGNVKAGNIGGLLGETVEVSTFADLKKYAESDAPCTIVITENLQVTNLTKDSSGRYFCPDGRIYVHSNKTIIGSYDAHTMYNVQFCTSSGKGVGNNVILKNMDLQHDAESNGNDSIVVYFGSGKNLWVDHCTFTGHADYNTASTGLVDNDKFLACCYDADYCTVSDCSFGLHEYGLILGYPADDENSYKNYNNFPRMTLISNSFNRTLTRAPGLMRYGYFHSLNNYVYDFSMAYTVHSASKVFAENCYYEKGGNVICDWNEVTYPGSYAETGSKSSGCKRTQIEGAATDCTWRPSTNYTYSTLTADAAKSHCTSNTGAVNNAGKLAYPMHTGVPSAGFMAGPDEGWNIAVIPAFETIEAESFTLQEGVKTEDLASGGQNIGFIENGDYIMFRNVDFEDGALSFTGRFSGNAAQVELYLDKLTGTPAAVLDFTGTGDFGSYDTYSWNIPSITGRHDLYLCFKGAEGYLLNADWFLFGRETVPMNGVLFRDLRVLDTENAADWSIAFGAESGASIFGDREVVYTELPEILAGAEYIRTACDSKNSSETLAVCTAGADMTVYICLDNRVESVPAWMEDFAKTGMTVSNDNDVVFDIYSKFVAQGDTIILGSNGQSAYCVNYSVLAKAGREAVWGDVNDDTQFTVADIVMLQKFLLGMGDLTSWKAADTTGDGAVNVLDLCLLKRKLVQLEG